MTVEQALQQLEALGSAAGRAQNTKRGATQRQFGARLGDIRALAKKIKSDQALAMALWETDVIDAQLLAVLLMKPQALSPQALEALVHGGVFVQVADWLNAYVVRKHPAREDLRRRWLQATDPRCARAGWSLTADLVTATGNARPTGNARTTADHGVTAQGPGGDSLDLVALLDRIAAELAGARPAAQWTMNATLAAIGIAYPEHRDRAIAIGEQLGVYRDYPTPKGCTSPFAPLWIAEMVRRQSAKRPATATATTTVEGRS